MNKYKFDVVKAKTATLTGHRPKSLPWGYDESQPSCMHFKEQIKTVFENAINHGIKIFLTGMAEGFDMIATEVLLTLKNQYPINIIAVIPCLGQESKWSKSQQDRYNSILSKCDNMIVLSEHYYPNCMNDRNAFMVGHSAFCIACWNGKPSGTCNTIKFAKANGNQIIVVDPKNF